MSHRMRKHGIWKIAGLESFFQHGFIIVRSASYGEPYGARPAGLKTSGLESFSSTWIIIARPTSYGGAYGARPAGQKQDSEISHVAQDLQVTSTSNASPEPLATAASPPPAPAPPGSGSSPGISSPTRTGISRNEPSKPSITPNHHPRASRCVPHSISQ